MSHGAADDPRADIYGSQFSGAGPLKFPEEGELPGDDVEAAPLTSALPPEHLASRSADGGAGRCARAMRLLGAAAGAAALLAAAWLVLRRPEPAVSELLEGAAGVMVLAFHTEFSASNGLMEAQLGYISRFAKNCSEVHLLVESESTAPRSLCGSLPRLRSWSPARFSVHRHCVLRDRAEWESMRHASMINWAMQNIVAKRPKGSGSFLLLDGDVVLVRDIDLSVLVSDRKWTCLPQSRNRVRYCWPGVLSLSPEIASPLALDFHPADGTDSGGRISWDERAEHVGPHGYDNIGVSASGGKIDYTSVDSGATASSGERLPRRVFVDLGANWANTLRLYQDIGSKRAERPWEVYAFEASPFMQPFLEKFVASLNGLGPRPAVTVPPSGSSQHLAMFAARYGCPEEPRSAMRQCMFDTFRGPLSQLQPDPALNDSALVWERLASARSPAVDGDRFVFVPAAAGDRDGLLDLGMCTAEQMIRGGAHSHPTGDAPSLRVPVVNIASWLLEHFADEDYLVVKMDVEGAEFGILDALLDRGGGCLIDLLALECHEDFGDCIHLRQKLGAYPCIQLLEEGTGYEGWDQYSAPHQYYAVDPRF